MEAAGGWPAGTWRAEPDGSVWRMRYAGGGDPDLLTDDEVYSPAPQFDTEDAAVDGLFVRVAALESRHTRRQ